MLNNSNVTSDKRKFKRCSATNGSKTWMKRAAKKISIIESREHIAGSDVIETSTGQRGKSKTHHAPVLEV